MGDHCPALNDYLCSQCPEALDMLVDGPAANIAASGKGNLGTLILTQKSAYKIIGGADLTDIFIVNGYFFYIACVNLNSVSVNPFNPCADLLNCL